jgi:hypothetical protein
MQEQRAMRAATRTLADPSPIADPAMPVVAFTFDQGIAPKPDQDAVAGFDALLASLDPDTARTALRECLAEIALWQHHLRVQESRYASDDARPQAMFRISG